MESTPLQRALAVAPAQATPEPPAARQELFCFRAGELNLAVPSIGVREVVRVAPLTALPRVPAFVLGVCAVRGEVLPVLDILRFLGKGESRVHARSRLFVATAATHVAAFLTDAVLGLRWVKSAEILPPPLGGEISEFVLGIIPGGRGETLAVLDATRLLLAARQKAVPR